MKKLLSTILAISMILSCAFNLSVFAQDDMTLSSATTDGDNLLLTFSQELQGVSTDDVDGYIELADENGDKAELTFLSAEGNVLKLAAKNPVYNTMKYTLTVSPGFSEITEDQTAEVTFVKAEIGEIFAGVGSVTVKYTAPVAEEEIGDITFTKKDGEEVPFAKSVKGNVLTLVPEEKLTRDTEVYTLEIGGVKKVFKLETMWEPTVDVETRTISGLKFLGSTDNPHGVAVLDNGEIVYEWNYGVLTPNINTNSKDYKNASFSFDVKYPAELSAAAYGFNANEITPLYFTWNGDSISGKDAFAWQVTNQNTANRPGAWHGRAYRLDTLSTVENKLRQVDYMDAPENIITVDRIMAKREYNAEAGTVKFTDYTNWVTSDNDITEKVAAADSYSYSIDKMGTFGTLTIDGQLVDRYETKDRYPEASKDSAREYGSFFIHVSAERPIVLGNMAITICADVDPTTGDKIPTQTDIDEIYAGPGSVTVKYKTDIDSILDLGEIILKDASGNKVVCEKSVKGKVLTLVPEKKLTRDTEIYSLQVGDKKVSFKLNTEWEPTVDVAKRTVSGLKFNHAGTLSLGVTDNGGIVYKENQSSIVPDINTNSEKFTNASFSFDAVYPNTHTTMAYGFNANKDNLTYLLWDGEVGTTDMFAWFESTQNVGKIARNWKIDTESTADNKVRSVSTQTTLTETETSSGRVLGFVTYNEDGTVAIEQATKDHEHTGVDITEEVDAMTPRSYSIDKVGSFATLTMDGGLIDRYETQDLYPEGANARETGYFFIVSHANVILKNMAITTFEFVPLQEPTVTEISEFYAGPGSVTVKYTEEDFDVLEVGNISLKDSEGEQVSVTSSVKGNVLTIVPKQKLAVDSVYTLTVGNNTKHFKLQKKWEPTVDVETRTVSGVKLMGSETETHGVAVLDNGEIVYKWNQGALFPTLDTNNEEYKNASFSFDVKYTSMNLGAGFGFNANENSTANLFWNGDGISRNADFFAWQVTNQNVTDEAGNVLRPGAWHGRAYRLDTLSTEENKLRQVDYMDAAENEIKVSRIEVNHTYNDDGTVKFTDYTNWQASDTDVTANVAAADSYSYSIDKMGTFGTLTMDGQLVDRYETKDRYPEESRDSAREYGNFFIHAAGDRPVVLSNMMITVCKEVDPETDEEIKASATFVGTDGEALSSVAGVSAVSGTVSVSSTYAAEKPVAVVVAAYAGSKLLDLEVLPDKKITTAGISGNYSFTGLEGLTEIKVLVWESLGTMKPIDMLSKK